MENLQVKTKQLILLFLSNVKEMFEYNNLIEFIKSNEGSLQLESNMTIKEYLYYEFERKNKLRYIQRLNSYKLL